MTLHNVIPPERIEREDPITGLTVQQLTSHRAHSWHLYFTESGWWGDGRQLVFNSDRWNSTGVYNLDLGDFSIREVNSGFFGQTLSRQREEVYGIGSRPAAVWGVKIDDDSKRRIYTAPEGFGLGGCSCTADGDHICLQITERNEVDTSRMGQGYVGFPEYFESHPLSKIVKVPLDGGKPEIVWEERNWITHVNASPTQPNLISFCHEGPWDRVKQRMWGLDLSAGRTWKIRPQEPADALGHEYWLEDGLTLGYHGRTADGPVFGFIRHDNSGWTEAHFPDHSQHFHSNTRKLIVGDGAGVDYVLLWQFDGRRFSKPRVLCRHRCSRHIQHTHVHPRLSPDGSYVLYTSDDTGYGNVYRVDIPEDLETLPLLEDVRK